MTKLQNVLNRINANPCTAWDPTAFPGLGEVELEAARRAWHAAIYAAAIALTSPALAA